MYIRTFQLIRQYLRNDYYTNVWCDDKFLAETTVEIIATVE